MEKKKRLPLDCLHDVFVSIWVKREALTIGNLQSYLHQAARLEALKHLAKDRFTTPLDDRLPQLTDDSLPCDARV